MEVMLFEKGAPRVVSTYAGSPCDDISIGFPNRQGARAALPNDVCCSVQSGLLLLATLTL